MRGPGASTPNAGQSNVLFSFSNTHDNQGPETLREISFNQAFGRDLQEALDWTKKYKKTLNSHDLEQAWELYYLVRAFHQL